MAENRFKVSGMSCSACSARVERVVAAVPGVQSVQVNLLTGSMQVWYTEEPTTTAIIAAVEAIGYGAELLTQGSRPVTHRKSSELRKRLFLSLSLLLPLTAAHHLWHSQPSALAQLTLALIILWLNRSFFIRGWRSAQKAAPTMDTLVALGAGAAMADGLANFFFHHREIYYFECAAMIVTLITLGKWLECRATNRTGAAIEKMLSLLPRTATILREGQQLVVPADSVLPGEVVLVKPGERLPVDGTVTEGFSAADESALTGESLPMEKTPGCKVYAGTINHNGALQVRTDTAAAESVLSNIITLVGEAAASKAPISRLADRLSAVFVPVVATLALLTVLVWLLMGAEVGAAISCGIAVLVISCPCALGLATPVAIMTGTGRAAEFGILFRNGAAVEEAHRTTTVVLDKTGTITTGTPSVVNILPAPGHSREELLQLAANLESTGNHPLASAIRKATVGFTPLPPEQLTYHPGKGLTAICNGSLCAVGNSAFMRELGLTPPTHGKAISEGKSQLFFAREQEIIGTLNVSDTIRPEAATAIASLKSQGIRVIMITGDSASTAAAIARRAGIEEFRAEALPQDKDTLIRRLQDQGHRVAMVGDGINDAPALTRADTGIAIGTGTDIAMESASVILTANNLLAIPGALCLSKAVIRNIRQNLFWACFYNTLTIPLAAMGLLHPAIAAAAMGLSSFCVVTNALRLRNLTPFRPLTMNTITIKTQGMMCPHCEAHVTKALLAIPGVTDCHADYKSGLVTVTSSQKLDLSTLHNTITAEGYTVL